MGSRDFPNYAILNHHAVPGRSVGSTTVCKGPAKCRTKSPAASDAAALHSGATLERYDTTQLESLAFRILAKRFSCVESGCSNTFRTKQFLNLSHRSLPSAAHKMLTGSPLQFANFCLLFQHVVCAARKIGNKGFVAADQSYLNTCSESWH